MIGSGAVRGGMILAALTEAESPFFRPIGVLALSPPGLATPAGYLRDDDEVVLPPDATPEPAPRPCDLRSRWEFRGRETPGPFRPPSAEYRETVASRSWIGAALRRC